MVECVKERLIEGEGLDFKTRAVLPLLGGSCDHCSLVPRERSNGQFRSVYYWDNCSPNEELFNFLPCSEQSGDVCLIQPAVTAKGSLLSTKKDGLILRQNGHALTVQEAGESQVGFNAVWRFVPRQGLLVPVPPDVTLCSLDCCLGILPVVYGMEMGVVVVETNKTRSSEIIALLGNYVPREVLQKSPQIKLSKDYSNEGR